MRHSRGDNTNTNNNNNNKKERLSTKKIYEKPSVILPVIMKTVKFKRDRKREKEKKKERSK